MRSWLIVKVVLLALLVNFSAHAATWITSFKNQDSFNRSIDTIANGDHQDMTHMLALKCRLSDGKTILSRIAVFQTDDENGLDYALVTGHGLVWMNNKKRKDSPCIVQDFSGNQRPVLNYALSDNYKEATQSDWGIIRFKAMPTKALIRYELPNIAWQSLSEEKIPVRFAVARGLKTNAQDCEILPQKYNVLAGHEFKSVVAHNCQAIGGQSGSPLSLHAEAKDLLLGIHIGRTWTLNTPITGKPGFQGFARIIDDKMLGDIQKMMKEMH